MPHQAPLQSGDPRRVGRYRLAGRIVGIPADGPIFLGSGPDGTEVTISILRGDWTGDRAGQDRFAAEAAVAKRVPPFCAARILDAGLDGSDAFLVSEYVPGKSLLEVISSDGLLTEDQVGPLAIGMATGLASVHYAGLVHGSFGPEYVVMTAGGPRVVEFGITPPYGTATPAADMLAWAQTVVFATAGRPATTLADLDVLPAYLRELVLDCLSPDPAARPGARAAVKALIGEDEIPAGLLAEGSHRARPGGFMGPAARPAAARPAAVSPADLSPADLSQPEARPQGGPGPLPVPGPPWEPQEPPGPRVPAGPHTPPAASDNWDTWEPPADREQVEPAAWLWAASGREEPGPVPGTGAAGPAQTDDGLASWRSPAARPPAGRAGAHSSGSHAAGSHGSGSHGPGSHAAGAHGSGSRGTGPRAISRHARPASDSSHSARSEPRPLADGPDGPVDRTRLRGGNGGSSAPLDPLGGSGAWSPRAGAHGGSGASSPRAGAHGGSGASSPRAGAHGGSGASSPRAGTTLRTGALAGAAALVVALVVFTAMRALGDHSSPSPQAGPKSTHSMSLRTSVQPQPSPTVHPTTPTSFGGAWSGQAQQPPNVTYSVSLTLPARSVTGTVRYSAAGVTPFSCTLVLTAVSGDKLTFSEASQGSCAAGTVTLTRSGTGRARYEFRGGGLVATGSLTQS
jgi:hypothetical protein